MKKIGYIAYVLMAIAVSESSSAYELATHGVLTLNAYQTSTLSQDPALLRGYGLDASSLNPIGEVYYEMLGAEVRERRQDDFERGKMPNDGRDFLTGSSRNRVGDFGSF